MMSTKPTSLLLVDDDKFLLDMYSLKFSKNGYDVHCAASPEEALKLLRDGAIPNIILLDVVMPGMDGVELLGVIRKEKLAETSVIIMLTNQSAPSDVERAQKLGVSGYIIKASTIPSEVLEEVTKIYKKIKG